MINVDIDELEQCMSEIGISKNEVASVLGFTRSTLWRWLSTGEIPEKAYVFLKVVRYTETAHGLRRVQILDIDFNDDLLNSFVDDFRREYESALLAIVDSDIKVPLNEVDSDDLIEELKRRNLDHHVIIAKVKSLN